MGNIPATEILKHHAYVEAALYKIDKSVLYIKSDKKWFRLIVHSIYTNNYVDSLKGMSQLRTEIESYNPSFVLFNNPHWLTRPEKRDGKKSSSVSIVVDNQDMAKKCVEKGLRVDMQLLKVEQFIINREDKQCSNCQKFGHHYARCTSKQPACRLCGASHKTTDHKCQTCKKTGTRCDHLTPFCINCQTTGHTASDNGCPIKKTIRPTRPTTRQPRQPTTTTTTTTSKPVVDQRMEGIEE